MNACATQAILSIVLNIEDPLPSFELGETLGDLRNFTVGMEPGIRGDIIGSNDVIREAHNSFTRQDPFVSEEDKTEGGKGEVYHFVSYVRHGGKVWELDGLKKGPVLLGDDNGDWVKVARERIQGRMMGDEGKGLFNLMSVGEDKREGIKRRITAVVGEGAEREVLEEDLREEQGKRVKWERENDRRRHNWIPFVAMLMGELARKGKMGELREKGKVRVEEKKKQGK